MTPKEIEAHWEKRLPEIEKERSGGYPPGAGPKKSKKGPDPSPWVSWLDLKEALNHIEILLLAGNQLVEEVEQKNELLNEFASQLGAVGEKHQKEIEHLKTQHALDLQKHARGF
jgi:hypothetical protein